MKLGRSPGYTDVDMSEYNACATQDSSIFAKRNINYELSKYWKFNKKNHISCTEDIGRSV